MSFHGKAAIAGIGATEFSKNSGRSELRLAIEAVNAALEDAGIEPGEVDGMVTFDADNNGQAELARQIRAGDLRYFGISPYAGGSGCGAVMQAAMAVTSGVANVVVCYRAMNERSEFRFGQPLGAVGVPNAEGVVRGYHAIHGLMTVAATIGIGIRRYMHETGTTSDDLAELAVTARRYASTNPAAFFYGKPITVEDYFASKLIAEPLRLLDCCQESDGGVALVITSTERAKRLKQPPAVIRAAAQGLPAQMVPLYNYYRDDISVFDETSLIARQVYAGADLAPKDMQAAIIYDHFLPTILPTLEAYGFCERGRARYFIRDGNIDIDGTLPLNPHGGQVGEAYIHGMNGIAEAVRQVRGTAVNQVSRVEHILATSGSAVPTSGMILGQA